MLRSEQPGILLFDNNDGKRLLIFVVGETPTSGVNRIQMEQALKYREDLLDKCKRDAPISNCQAHDYGGWLNGPIMIAGPHFSGTLESLYEVLKDSSHLLQSEADTSNQLKIISPDASSDRLIEWFNTKCNSDASCIFEPLSDTASTTDEAAARYLKHLGYKREQIAELVEDESGFGDEQPYKEDCREDNSKSGSNFSPFCLVLTFPRELSAVRSLSDQQSEQLAESGAKILSLAKVPAPVKLSSESPTERDRPLTYASEDEATEISNALEDRVRVIREKHIECVVVSATNPLDRIFLLDYLHDRLPNIRLVVEQADQLEISHPHFVDLTGTIVISSLPAIPELVATQKIAPRPISFPSVSAEEQFLSVAMLLDNAMPNKTTNGAKVSIVGEESFEFNPFWNDPASALKDGKISVFNSQTLGNDGKVNEGITLNVTRPQDVPRSFISFSIAIFALTIVHLCRWLSSEWRGWLKKVLLAVKGHEPGAASPLQRSPSRFAYLAPGLPEDPGRTFTLLALNNQILLLNVMILVVNPHLDPFHKEHWTALDWIAFGAWIMLLFTGVASLVLLKRYFLPRKEQSPMGQAVVRPRPSLKRFLTTMAVPLVFSLLMLWYLVSSIVFLISWRSAAAAEWHRVLTLDDGLSPVIPIAAVLLAWALWAVFQVRRVRWSAYRKVDLWIPKAVPTQKISLGEQLWGDMKALHDEIDPPTIGLGKVAFILCFVGVVSWWQWPSLRGIEPNDAWTSSSGTGNISQLVHYLLLPRTFEWWFAIWGFVMLLMTVIQTAYQLRQIWVKLARLLKRLQSTRMRCAFEKLGKDDRIHIKLWGSWQGADAF